MAGHSNVVKLISLPGEVQRPHFSYKHIEGKAEYLRLEFNPRKLGRKGLSKLHSVLISLVPDGWEFFIENGKITRIDLAVNVVGVRMDEFLFLPATGLISKHWTKDGFLETITIGLPQGNQTLVYAKKKQRLAKKQPFLGPSTIRVERVLRKPSPGKLLELGVLANPFAHMTLLPTLPQPPSDEKEWQWSMFKDSVKVRGLVNALKLLPENRRKKYRDHLKTQGVSWWDPQAIWKHWQQAYSWLCEPNPLPSSTLSTLSPSDYK